MGYYIYVKDSKFSIKQENLVKSLKAIQALRGKETIKDYRGEHFSWVSDNFYTIDNIHEMLDEWRWKASYTEEGDIKGISFLGEKFGDDKFLFQALAPYVEVGSYIHFVGEDGEQWRYEFDGKVMKEKKAKITFEDN